MATRNVRPLPGGPLAIDLLNTEWMASVGRVDWFDDDDCVIGFAAEYGSVIGAAQVAEARAALVGIRQLVRRMVERSVIDDSLSDDVNAALEHAKTAVRVSDDALVMQVTGNRVTNAVAIDALVNAIELVGDRPDRIRSCEHESCVLWFHDTSKAGRRRWCSMETCGNRAKARRHYQRTAHPSD